ncbi:hypothetical protein [Spiroplasma taiwanense]|nr:hypothetical protein [Spiroplasma taiwanense]
MTLTNTIICTLSSNPLKIETNKSIIPIALIFSVVVSLFTTTSVVKPL